MDLANAICAREAGEIRDKAFALQAILQRLMEKELPVPNSSRLVDDIYEELTVRVLDATQSLQFLTYAAWSPLPGKSSWVPNWADGFERLWLQPPIVGGEPYNATPGSKSSWTRRPENSNVLVVRGKQLYDEIRCISVGKTQAVTDTEDHRDAQRTLLVRHIEVITGMFEYYHYDRGIVAKRLQEMGLPVPPDSWMVFFVVMRTLEPEAIVQILEEPAASNTLCLFATSKALRRFCSQIWAEVEHMNPMTGCSIFWTCVTSPVKNIRESTESLIDFMAQRSICLFFTEKSRSYQVYDSRDRRWDEYVDVEDQTVTRTTTEKRFGICHQRARVGDLIVTVAGVRLPLIMLRTDGALKLVSPALIGGSHGGSGWDQTYTDDDLAEYALS